MRLESQNTTPYDPFHLPPPCLKQNLSGEGVIGSGDVPRSVIVKIRIFSLKKIVVVLVVIKTSIAIRVLTLVASGRSKLCALMKKNCAKWTKVSLKLFQNKDARTEQTCAIQKNFKIFEFKNSEILPKKSVFCEIFVIFIWNSKLKFDAKNYMRKFGEMVRRNAPKPCRKKL